MNEKLNTQSYPIDISPSYNKTYQLTDEVNDRQTLNTEISVINIEASSYVNDGKAPVVLGANTDSVNVIIGGDNMVRAYVQVSEDIDNAITIKTDGLHSPRANYLGDTTTTANITYDNENMTTSVDVLNSPKLAGKFEEQLSVDSAKNFSLGGNIATAFASKVNNEDGKALSTNDFSTTYMDKLININTANYVEFLNYNVLDHKLVYNDSIGLQDIPLLGLLSSVSYDGSTGKMTFKVANGSDIVINLPKENFVSSGYYDNVSKNIILVLQSGSTINIPAEELVNIYLGASSNSVEVTVSNDNHITANVVVSPTDNNALSATLNGLYVSTVNKTSLGLDQVNNTSDNIKPVSTVQKTYIDNSINNLSNQTIATYVPMISDDSLSISVTNGNIVFSIDGVPKLEINSEGVNFKI